MKGADDPHSKRWTERSNPAIGEYYTSIILAILTAISCRYPHRPIFIHHHIYPMALTLWNSIRFYEIGYRPIPTSLLHSSLYFSPRRWVRHIWPWYDFLS